MIDSQEVPFPLSGVDVSGEFGVQRPGTCADAANVRATDPILERNRGGSRHGLAKYPSDQLPSGANPSQFLGQLVVLSQDYLLQAFQDFDPDFISDPSTNNLTTRNPAGRKVPPLGSGVQLNRNLPRNPRRQLALVPSATTLADGQTLTLTATLLKENVGSVVSGVTVTLITQPAGRAGDGQTAVTNGSGVATFTVSESTFEGRVRYLAVNEYTSP